MSADTPSEESAGAARRRRLRARGRIARKPPPTLDDKPSVWPKRVAVLLLVGGVGYGAWSQRARVGSLWGSARQRLASLTDRLFTEDAVEFTEDMEVDVPDTFAEAPVPTKPAPDWTDPDSVDPDLAPLPGPPPGYTPEPPPTRRPPEPSRKPPTPSRPPPPPPSPTQVAVAPPTTPPEPPAPAGPGWRARAGDLWSKTKRGFVGLRAKLASGAAEAQVQWAKLMGKDGPAPSPTPSMPALDPNFDPFAIGAKPTPKPSPTAKASPEPTQVAAVDPLSVVMGPDWVPPAEPSPTPLATRDPWDHLTPPATPRATTKPTPPQAASPWTARLAGAEGQRLALADGVRLDLHPYTRYRRVGDEVVLLSGGALVRFPPGGGSLRLTGGLRLRGEDQLFEVSGVESAGTVDALTGGLVLEATGRTPATMKAMERRYLDEDLAEPVPLSQAGTFVRRLAWFDSHPRRDRAAARALELAERVLAETTGTSRELAAKEAVAAAITWAERVAMRHQRELTARL